MTKISDIIHDLLSKESSEYEPLFLLLTNPESCSECITTLSSLLNNDFSKLHHLGVLYLLGSCMQKVVDFPKAMCTSINMLDTLSMLGKSSDSPIQQKALTLIHEWGNAYKDNETLTAFHETYLTLKLENITFPNRNNLNENVNTDPFLKLHDDLKVVEIKMESVNSGKMDQLEFLKQCQPRMNILIEAGLMGKLDEETLERCLKVNDQLVELTFKSDNNIEDDSEEKGDATEEKSLATDLLTGEMQEVSLQDTHAPPVPTTDMDFTDAEFGSFLTNDSYPGKMK